MPAYTRKITVDDEFGTRRAPDGSLLCGNCNNNITENPAAAVYLLYTDKRHVRVAIPHDLFRESCFRKYLRKTMMV